MVVDVTTQTPTAPTLIMWHKFSLESSQMMIAHGISRIHWIKYKIEVDLIESVD